MRPVHFGNSYEPGYVPPGDEPKDDKRDKDDDRDKKDDDKDKRDDDDDKDKKKKPKRDLELPPEEATPLK